jgi:hypothetical protein
MIAVRYTNPYSTLTTVASGQSSVPAAARNMSVRANSLMVTGPSFATITVSVFRPIYSFAARWFHTSRGIRDGRQVGASGHTPSLDRNHDPEHDEHDPRDDRGDNDAGSLGGSFGDAL